MSVFTVVLFSFLAAGSLILIFFLLALVVQNSPRARIRERMTALSYNNPPTSSVEVQRLLKGSHYTESPTVHHFLAQLPFAPQLELLLERANINVTVGTLLLFCLCTGGMAWFFAFTFFHQPFPFALLVGALAASMPYLYVRLLAHRRLQRFLEQMPDGLDMMSQGLQIGLGLTQAQRYIAKEAPDPIGTEFSVFLEELNLGLPVREALERFQQRIPLPETRLFSTAVLVQREVGGNLAEVLNNLAHIIRERFRVEREIRTLTAQNRISAWIVCSLPPLLYAYQSLMDLALMHEVVHNPIGRLMLIAALVMEILGILVFRRLLRLHI